MSWASDERAMQIAERVYPYGSEEFWKLFAQLVQESTDDK